MLSVLQPKRVYLKVRKNQFQVRRIDTGAERTFESLSPFTTSRELVGQFSVAESTLTRAWQDMGLRTRFGRQPEVLVHPLEMVDGGLSQVEDRVLRELTYGAGASKVVIWYGQQLSDGQVQEKLNNG